VYTILGHGSDAHLDTRYRQLVAQALLWASGRS
jgi:type 1 glutamine amidotransferase